jgi:hypothetical protein
MRGLSRVIGLRHKETGVPSCAATTIGIRWVQKAALAGDEVCASKKPRGGYQRCTGLPAFVFAILAAVWIARAFLAAARMLQAACAKPLSLVRSQSSWSRCNFCPGSMSCPQRTHGVP